MLSFLLYDVKVAIALAVFYMFYRLMLQKETFHRLNRIVLVGSVVVSFLLPLCIITIHKPIEMDTQVLVQPMVLTDMPAQELASIVGTTSPWWLVALTILFWAGAALVLARVLVSVLCIARIIKLGQLVQEEDGCKIIVTDRDIDPFSWMRYIVLSRKDWEGDHAPIITHEKAHIGFRHSMELLVVDVLSAFQWFNPAIWMLRADLRELHEYEADDAVLRSGANIKEYQYLLIKKAVGKSGYSVANSFNHSILKNRITMMSKSKSSLMRGLRVLYLLPLICLGINPSTAAPDHLDPTLKSVERIARSNGYDSFIMLNVCAQRATSPGDMDVRADERLHAENLRAFDYLLSLRPRPAVWAAWGNLVETRPYLLAFAKDMIRLGNERGAEWYCCGPVSRKGHPHHPLYLKTNEPLVPFGAEAYLQNP